MSIRSATTPTLVAQLGAYDPAWLHQVNDEIWTALAGYLSDRGLDGVPAALDRERTLEQAWTAPNLLLAQACGYPLMTELAGRVRTVGTPLYRSPYARGMQNRSAVIVHARSRWDGLADLRGTVAAVNAWNSNSGMNLLRAVIAPLAEGAPFFARVSLTGSHLASIEAVATDQADVAAIDGVTFGLLDHHRPDLLRRIRVLTTTIEAPGLPLITRAAASDAEVELLRAGIESLIAEPRLAEARAAIGLVGFARTTPADYATILAIERAAIERGYPRLT